MTEAVDRLSRELEACMREQFFTDPQGRRVHKKHVSPEGRKRLWVSAGLDNPRHRNDRAAEMTENELKRIRIWWHQAQSTTPGLLACAIRDIGELTQSLRASWARNKFLSHKLIHLEEALDEIHSRQSDHINDNAVLIHEAKNWCPQTEQETTDDGS